MQFDLSSLPNTIDLLHLGLGIMAAIELMLLVILLSIIVISLFKKVTSPARPQKTIESKPAKPAPSRVPSKKEGIEEQASVPRVSLKESSPDSALQLLGLLQQEARFIDFIEEDMASFSDAEIGAAARIVHEGCHKVLHNHLELAPVRQEQENSRITVKSGFDPSAIRLTGNIVGEAPFKGTLVHRGWRVTDIRLPKMADGHNVDVVASAEVEL